MGIEIAFSVISAAATVIAGALASIIAARLNQQKSIEIDKIDDLLAASKEKIREAQTELATALAEKLPEGLSAEQVVKRLEKPLQIGGDLIINQIARDSGAFIEDLVNSYHQQALSQARVQFWFSVVAATVGFVFILYAASTTPISSFSDVLRILPGVLIDAVAALFFRQAEQTRQRATELYDRLRKDNQMTIAGKILESITDPQIKSFAQLQIALHLAGVTQKEIDLSSVVPRASTSPVISENHHPDR